MPVEGGGEVKTYIPKRLREMAGHPPRVTDVTDESPVLTPSVSNVSGGGGVFPEKNGSEPEPQNLETQRPEPQDAGVSSPVLPMPSPAVENLEPEPIEAEPEDGYQLLPAQSPWLELGDSAQGIWDALETRGTRTLHLIDQDGRKACYAFTASKPSDLRELARRGLKTFPRVKRLTVIAVLPEVQIWHLESRELN